jgi:hypothetical protein
LFEILLEFHLANRNRFEAIQEAAEFLDLPAKLATTGGEVEKVEASAWVSQDIARDITEWHLEKSP